MSDPRITPDPAMIHEHRAVRVALPVVNLTREPEGKRDRQVLLGERLIVLGRCEAHVYVVSEKDGYHGYVKQSAVVDDHPVTHRIKAIASHMYCDCDMKSPELAALSHGSLINVIECSDKFAKTKQGFIPLQHLCDMRKPDTDFTEVAKLFLGVPYLWGGNSSTGIDCSGLIQAALTACAIPCPGDSDLQEAAIGADLPSGSPVRKGDLFFWKGHVALAVDSQTLIHANAHHMACVYEPITQAISRIQQQGDGPVTSHKRLDIILPP